MMLERLKGGAGSTKKRPDDYQIIIQEDLPSHQTGEWDRMPLDHIEPSSDS